MKYDYDVLVIGSGSGGLTVAFGLAAAGKKVALVERAQIGGDCTNYGCIPSKALIDVAKSGKYTFLEAMTEMRARRQAIRDEETPAKIERSGLRVIAGFASFKDAHTVLIDDKNEVTGKYIVISTGSHANMIEIPGVKSEDILTNETVFEITEDIKDLIVVGGGYIGCELAEAFLHLGVRVTIVQRNDRLIPREEPESSRLLRDQCEAKGMQVFTSSKVEKAEKGFLDIKNAQGNIQKVKYDKILVALGRDPNMAKLGLENIGINFEKGVIVDAYSRTNIANIFAIGDCVEENPQFTHLANNEGRGVIRNILVPFWKSSFRNVILPSVLYTSLEVARAGKTEEELIEIYGRDGFRTEMINFTSNDRSMVTKDTQGFVKIHFKRLTGQILGATVMGTHAGEMIPVLALAMQNNISAYKLGKLIFPYPTKSELIKKVCDRFVIYSFSHIRKEIGFFLKDHILQISTLILWISIVSTFLYFKSIYSLTNLEIAKQLYNFLISSYWGPVLYILIYAIRPIVLFPATLLTFLSGALFGIWGGFLYTMIGENISANFAYFIGRIFGKKIIPEGSNGMLATLKSRFEKQSFIPLLMTRFLFFPFDLVNYGAGILKMNWSGFFWATLVGIIPGALVFIIAGASIENISSFDITKIQFNASTLGLSLGIFLLSIGVAQGIGKWESRRKS